MLHVLAVAMFCTATSTDGALCAVGRAPIRKGRSHSGGGGENVLHTQGLASTVVILADDTDVKIMAVTYVRGHPSAPDLRLL